MLRHRLLAIFLSIMLVLGWFIYMNWSQTENRNRILSSEIAMHEDVLKAKPPPPRVVEETRLMQVPKTLKKGGKHSEPVMETKTITTYKVDRTETDKFLQQQQISLELIGVLKLQLNPNNSWETIAQILVLLLFSYGGVKIINKKFS